MKNYQIHCTITGCGPKTQLERCFCFIMKSFDDIFDQVEIDINLDTFDYFTKYEENYAGIRFLLSTKAQNLELLFRKSLEKISSAYGDLVLMSTMQISGSESEPRSFFYNCGKQKTVTEINSKYLQKALRRAEYEKRNAKKDYSEIMLAGLRDYLLNDLGCLLDSNSFLKAMHKSLPNVNYDDEYYHFNSETENDSPQAFPDPAQRKLLS